MIENSEIKKETLYKLLAVEPETLDNLARATGWGRDPTQHALLQLIADCRVTCKNCSGRRLYYVRARGCRPACTCPATAIDVTGPS